MTLIINLTKDIATPEQIAVGVVDLPTSQRNALINALYFESAPTVQEVLDRVVFIADLACYNGLGGDNADDPVPIKAMVETDLYLFGYLVQALRVVAIEPVVAYYGMRPDRQAQEGDPQAILAHFRFAGFLGLEDPTCIKPVGF